MFQKNVKLSVSLLVALLLTLVLASGALAIPPGPGDEPVVDTPVEGSIAVGTTATFTKLGIGGNIIGTYQRPGQAAPAVEQGWGGSLQFAMKDTNEVGGAFCTDLHHGTNYNTQYTVSSEAASCPISYIVENYPAKITGITSEEGAARQMAVWTYSDGFKVNAGSYASARLATILSDVKAKMDAGMCANWQPVTPVQFDVVAVAGDNGTAGSPIAYNVVVKLKGQPVAGVNVSLATTAGTLSAASVTTGADGTAGFTITNAAAGTAKVSATATVLIPAKTIFTGSTNPEVQKLILTEPKNGKVFAAANPVWQAPTGAVTVKVFNDKNVNSVDNSEVGLSGWTVQLKDSTGKVVKSGNTDANGAVNFTGVANGTYTVAYTLKAGWGDTNSPDAANRPSVVAATASVTINNDSKYVDFGVVQLPVVKVQVYNDANVNGSLENGEALLKGWTVELHRAVDGSIVSGANGVTGNDGWVIITFPRLSEFLVGDYYVRLIKQDGWLPYQQDRIDDGGVNTANFNLQPASVQVIQLGVYQVSTAVTLDFFKAEPTVFGKVALTWQTATETDNAGFNIYRASSPVGPWTLVNDKMIVAQANGATGAIYTFTDTPGNGTFYYKMQDIDLRGLVAEHDSVMTTVEDLLPLRHPMFRPALPK